MSAVRELTIKDIAGLLFQACQNFLSKQADKFYIETVTIKNTDDQLYGRLEEKVYHLSQEQAQVLNQFFEKQVKGYHDKITTANFTEGNLQKLIQDFRDIYIDSLIKANPKAWQDLLDKAHIRKDSKEQQDLKNFIGLAFHFKVNRLWTKNLLASSKLDQGLKQKSVVIITIIKNSLDSFTLNTELRKNVIKEINKITDGVHARILTNPRKINSLAIDLLDSINKCQANILFQISPNKISFSDADLERIFASERPDEKATKGERKAILKRIDDFNLSKNEIILNRLKALEATVEVTLAAKFLKTKTLSLHDQKAFHKQVRIVKFAVQQQLTYLPVKNIANQFKIHQAQQAKIKHQKTDITHKHFPFTLFLNPPKDNGLHLPKGNRVRQIMHRCNANKK